MLASFLPELTINFQCCGWSLVSALLSLHFIASLSLPTCLPQSCNCNIALRVFLFVELHTQKSLQNYLHFQRIFNVFSQIFSRNSIEVFLSISVLFHFLFLYYYFFFFGYLNYSTRKAANKTCSRSLK